MFGNMTEKIREMLFRPKVDEKVLDEALRMAKAGVPPPVVWLLGKTQSGKTSIIRSLTGSPDAEIGNGFQSCTKTSRFYDHPADAPVVRFLDTQGLGEVDYDPSEDIAFCEFQAHLVIAVVKAAEGIQDDVFDVLRKVRIRHPEWPVIVAQTCLHELYAPDSGHIQPYPFDTPGWEQIAPPDLARSLLFQRKELGTPAGIAPVIWTPVDLTLPEDGITPHDYGLAALWAAIEQATEMELKSRLMGSEEVRDVFGRAAHQQIVGYTIASAAFGALPLVDMALVPALQTKMLHSLGTIYNVDWDKKRISEFIGLLGSGFLVGYGLRLAGRSLLKAVPVAGQTAGAAYGAVASAGITFGLGKAAAYYLERTVKGQSLDAEAVRKVFAEAVGTGKKMAAAMLTKERK